MKDECILELRLRWLFSHRVVKYCLPGPDRCRSSLAVTELVSHRLFPSRCV